LTGELANLLKQKTEKIELKHKTDEQISPVNGESHEISLTDRNRLRWRIWEERSPQPLTMRGKEIFCSAESFGAGATLQRCLVT